MMDIERKRAIQIGADISYEAKGEFLIRNGWNFKEIIYGQVNLTKFMTKLSSISNLFQLLFDIFINYEEYSTVDGECLLL